MYDNGIKFINDLMKENGKFYNLEELKKQNRDIIKLFTLPRHDKFNKNLFV